MKDDKCIPIIKKNNLDDNMDILIFYNKYMHCEWMMIIIIIIINVVYCHKNLLQLLFANIKLSAMMMNDESKKRKEKWVRCAFTFIFDHHVIYYYYFYSHKYQD